MKQVNISLTYSLLFLFSLSCIVSPFSVNVDAFISELSYLTDNCQTVKIKFDTLNGFKGEICSILFVLLHFCLIFWSFMDFSSD